MKDITLTDTDLFIAKEKENLYCQTHDIDLRRLPSGMILVGTNRAVEDLADARIHFSFPTGSYFDPKGKSGIHHLLEHLSAFTPLKIAQKHHTYFNATTSSQEVRLIAKGSANPQVKDYGLWNILPNIMTEILPPYAFTKKLSEILPKEKEVVFNEITEDQANHNAHVRKTIDKIVLDASNPLRTNTLGEKEDLSSITEDDILQLTEKVFIPNDLVVDVFSEGSSATHKILLDTLEPELSNMDGKKHPAPDKLWDLLDNIHPDFTPLTVHTKNTGLKNNIITIIFLWVFDTQIYSVEDLAFTRFMHTLDQHVFHYIRSSGFGYSGGASYFMAGNRKFIAQLTVNVTKTSDIENYAKKIFAGLQTEAFGKIDEKELEHITENEKKMHQAVPMTAAARFSYIVSGLVNYDKMIDVDEIKKRFQQISTHHLQAWKEKFEAVKPATIIVGDLE